MTELTNIKLFLNDKKDKLIIKGYEVVSFEGFNLEMEVTPTGAEFVGETGQKKMSTNLDKMEVSN